MNLRTSSICIQTQEFPQSLNFHEQAESSASTARTVPGAVHFSENQIPQHPNLHVTRVCPAASKITTGFVGAHRLSHGAYESRGRSAHRYTSSTLFIENIKALPHPRPPIPSECKQTHPPGDRSHRCGGEGVVDRNDRISLY